MVPSCSVRPGVYPVEHYSETRVSEFLEEDRLTDKEVASLRSVA